MAIIVPLTFCYSCEDNEAMTKVTFIAEGDYFLLCQTCTADMVNVIDVFNIDATIVAYHAVQPVLF